MKWYASHTIWAAIGALSIQTGAIAPGPIPGGGFLCPWPLSPLDLRKRTKIMCELLPFTDHALKATIPGNVYAATILQTFVVTRSKLKGPIPDSVGYMRRLRQFDVSWNFLQGAIPYAFHYTQAMAWFDVNRNYLTGPLPEAVGFRHLKTFNAEKNRLCGAIPDAFGNTSWLQVFHVEANSLRGAIPAAVIAWTKLESLSMSENGLLGAIPHILRYMRRLTMLAMSGNGLRGTIPQSFRSTRRLMILTMSCNGLRGAIPKAVFFCRLEGFAVSNNNLRGAIPDAVISWSELISFRVESNSLSGTIPAALAWGQKMRRFAAFENQLSGSIPSGLLTQFPVEPSKPHWHTYMAAYFHSNRLTGTLPALKCVGGLTASGNLFEGGLPKTFNSHLTMLDVSGLPGRSGGVIGPFPPALCQLSALCVVTIANQQLSGAIPFFTSTLSRLALQHNRLKLFRGIHFVPFAKARPERLTSIFLHDNLLSCSVPECGNASAQTSLIAIGNRLRYPNGKFPTWVHKYEQDPLMWVSGTDGMALVVKISGASFFMLAVTLRFGYSKLLRALDAWQIGPSTHSWVVKASSHIHAGMVINCLLAVIFIMFLLSWDEYACPQTLAIASACLQSSAFIRTLVLLCWGKLFYLSLAVMHLTMESEDQIKRTWTDKMSRKRLLLWLLWCVVVVVLSTPVILYQVAKSTPGYLQNGRILSLCLQAGIGSIQGLVSNFIVPSLAKSMTGQKHVFTTISSFVMSCLIPFVLIMYLDTGCLSRWVTFWEPCRSNSEMFQYRLICTDHNRQDCDESKWHFFEGIEIQVLRSSDICEPHFSWSSTSISRCIQVTLLRLQEVWLAKFVTTGLTMQGFALMSGKLPTEAGAIVGNFGICMAYALVASSHLPLMNFVLLLAFFGEGFVARVAWVEKSFKATYVQNLVARSARGHHNVESHCTHPKSRDAKINSY